MADGGCRVPANGRRYTPTDGPEVLRTVGAITQQVAQTGSVRNEHTQAEAEEAARARAGEHQSSSHCSSSSAEVAAAAVRLGGCTAHSRAGILSAHAAALCAALRCSAARCAALVRCYGRFRQALSAAHEHES